MSSSKRLSLFDPNKSLSSNFDLLKEKFENCSQFLNGNQIEDTKKIEALYNDFEILENSIKSAEIYSTINETVKDIQTEHLKFLLIQYYLAILMLTVNDLNKRLNALITSKKHFKTFAKIMLQLEIAHQMDLTALKAITSQDSNNLENFNNHNNTSKKNPIERRADAISRLKRSKEIESTIDGIRQKLKLNRQNSSTNDSNQNYVTKQSNDESAENINDFIDDDIQREFWLTCLEQAILSTLQEYKNLDQEIQFLKYRASIQKQESNQNSQSSNSISKKIHNSIPQQDSNAPRICKITPESIKTPIPRHMKNYLKRIEPSNQSFSQSKSRTANINNCYVSNKNLQSNNINQIVSDISADVVRRSQFASTLFRDPNPALLSVEEWACKEQFAGRLPTGQSSQSAEKLNEIAQRKSNYINSHQEPTMEQEDERHSDSDYTHELDDLNSLKIADQRLYEQREWDNWKDEHEKGIGNRMK